MSIVNVAQSFAQNNCLGCLLCQIPSAWAVRARLKSHPFRSGFVLGSVPSTASALLPFTALGLVALGGVVVATLSATACTEELGAEIVVAHITRAVGGVTIASRRITIHHFSLPHLFCSLYLYYSTVCFICQEEILRFL